MELWNVMQDTGGVDWILLMNLRKRYGHFGTLTTKPTWTDDTFHPDDETDEAQVCMRYNTLDETTAGTDTMGRRLALTRWDDGWHTLGTRRLEHTRDKMPAHTRLHSLITRIRVAFNP